MKNGKLEDYVKVTADLDSLENYESVAEKLRQYEGIKVYGVLKRITPNKIIFGYDATRLTEEQVKLLLMPADADENDARRHITGIDLEQRIISIPENEL